MSRARNYFAWQSRLAGRDLGRRVLEVGCGLGNLTGTLLDREAVIAVDVEPACVERLLQRYPGRKNLHAFVADAAGAGLSRAAAFRPDSCVCLNVLEHIADDRASLEAMSAVLPGGGVVVVLVPAFP